MLMANGILLQLSPPSSRPPTLTSRTWSLATVTQTKMMTLHLTTTANSLFCLWEAYRVYFLFSLFFLFMLPLVSFVEGTSLYTSLRYQADADA